MGTIRILWAALTASQLFYALPLVLAGPSGGDDSIISNEIRLAFRAVAAAAALISIVLYRRKLTPDALDQAVQEAVRSGSTAAKVQAQAFVIQIVCLALNETITLMGFVQALPSHDIRVMVPWLASGLALNLLMFPRTPSPGTSRGPSDPNAQNASNG